MFPRGFVVMCACTYTRGEGSGSGAIAGSIIGSGFRLCLGFASGNTI